MSEQAGVVNTSDSVLANASTTVLPAEIDALVAEAAVLRSSDVPQALKRSEQAYALAKEAQPLYPEGLADSLYELATANSFLGKVLDALEQAHTALDLYQQLQLPHKKARVLERLGILHQQLGDYPTALRYHFDKLHLLEANQEQQGLARSHLFIGMTHAMSGNLVEARSWYEKGLIIAQATGDRATEGSTWNNLAVDYRTLGDHERALACGLKSLAIAQELGEEVGVATALSTIGEAYMVATQYDKALAYCMEALARFKQLHGGIYGPAAVETLLHIGRIHLSRNEPAEALAALQQTLAIAEQAGFSQYAYMSHEALAETYERTGDMAQAFAHYKQYHTIKERVINETSQRTIQQFEVIYRMQQARAETEREKRLREQDRQYFEQLARMKNEFISTASHDLRNPVSNMLSLLYLLNRHGRLADEKGQHYLRQLEKQTQQIRELITDVFDLAKLETGRALEQQLVYVAPFLHDLLESFRPLAEQNQLVLVFTSPDNTLIATFDPIQIRRVVNNLLANAIKYTPAGGRISVTATKVEAASELLIQVTDTGLGIPPADLPHIFEHFYRVQDERHQVVEGSGLGLAICKTIVDQHQGRIGVESQPGAGSRFFFTLPIRAAL
jgi:signal transduction histidine kinase